MEELLLTKPYAEVRRTGSNTGPDPALHPRTLRMYPESPSGMHLQVRAVLGQKTPLFAGVNLSATEVRQVRDYLTRVLVEHFQEKA